MNNEQFKEEMHCYLDNVYSKFQLYQDIVFSILKETDRICRNNSIHYYLAFGTLLGAIRDKRQIPWDYDVDIEVPITERDALMEALKSDLSRDYYYAYYDNVDKYPSYCIRVGKKGYHFNALHVDIFFLIGCPDNENDRKAFIENVNNYCDKRLSKHSDYWFGNHKTKIGKLRAAYSKMRYLMLTDEKLNSIEKQIIEEYPLGETQYCCTLGKVLKAKGLKLELYGEGKNISIDGYEYRIPNSPELILESIYGDYSKYMDIKSRFEEFYNMAFIVEERNKHIY